MKKEKIEIKVLIEKDQIFEDSYNQNQKLRVVLNKAVENLTLNDSNDRTLRREDGSELTDFDKTIEELGIRDGETLRFFLKAPKPDRDKGFA